MSSSTEPRVLRGAAAAGAATARLDVDLRTSPYARRFGADPRLVSPALEQAFTEAVAAAEADASQQGYADGFQEGYSAAAAQVRAAAEGEAAQRRAADEARDAALGQAIRALAAATAQLEGRQALHASDVESAVVAAGYRLAEALLGHEPALARDAVTRALRLAPHGLPVTLHMNPADAAALADADLAALAGGRPVSVVADPGVSPGGCVADAGAMHIDAQLDAALARVREAIGQ